MQPKPPAIKPAAAPKGASLKVAPPTPPAHVIPPSPVKPLIIPGMIMLDQKTYLAADIDKMPHPSGAQVASAEGPGGGSGGQGDQPMGGRTGPDGAAMWNSEWYHAPTAAEAALYTRKALENGWGEVACKTAPRDHVVDCVELGDSRPGLGIARFIRESSSVWLVHPPRLNGHKLLDVWVAVHLCVGEGSVTAERNQGGFGKHVCDEIDKRNAEASDNHLPATDSPRSYSLPPARASAGKVYGPQ